MSEKATGSPGEKPTPREDNVVEYILDEPNPVSSYAGVRGDLADKTPAGLDESSAALLEPDESRSPVFNALAAVELPELGRENRAKLLMQSPNRLYFYWSVRKNPFQTLVHALGPQTGVYTLVAKLTDLDRDREELHRVDAEGNWWFDVEANTRYRAEIGFYAPNRPYVRVMYSNTIQTPRRNPSPHSAASAQWRVTSDAFAEVLDVSGFSRDAYDVATVGDDRTASDETARSSMARIFEVARGEISDIGAEEIRFALAALGSGFTLEQLRWHIGPRLFAVLQARMAKLGDAETLARLQAETTPDEFADVEEELGPRVFGASLIGFPKRLRRRPSPSELSPLSSSSLSSRN